MAISKVQPKVKTIDAPSQHKEKTTSYAKTLSKTTKTVAQLYDAYQNYFPVEYGLLINPVRLPTGNGNILRFSKNTIDGYVMVSRPKSRVDPEFTNDELADLSNCRVFLEPNQTELNYIDRWFKYIIAKREITDYRLRQMYWMSKLDDDSEDDVNDPDYIPEDESEEEDDVYESEGEEDSEEEDDSPDYTPSVESELEDSEAEEEDDSEDEDKSPDYAPSVESEEEENDDDYEDVVNKYKLLKQKLKEQHQKQIARKSQKTRAH
jgi:hypothetical protein